MKIMRRSLSLFLLTLLALISMISLKEATGRRTESTTDSAAATTSAITTSTEAATTTAASSAAAASTATTTSTAATTTSTTATATLALKKKKKGKKGAHTNSIGLKVDTSVILEKFPFMVTRCDQLVLFKAKYISDMGDYRFRKDGFFTISAYYVNQFRDKDAKKLDQSVLLTESTKKASHLRGARGCVVVSGGKHRQDIGICLANKKQAKNILAVIKAFENCRGGDDLQPISADLIRQLIKACGKNGKFINPFKLAQQLKNKNKKTGGAKKKKTLRKFSNNPWYNNRKNHFHPGKLKVPGTR